MRQTLATVALNTQGNVLLNADDQNCLQIAQGNLKSTIWFGFADTVSKASNLQYAPTYLSEIAKPTASVTLTSQQDRKVSVLVDKTSVSFKLPSRGAHFALDAVAAIATAREILGDAFDPELSADVLDKLPPVFSRGEVRTVNGESIEFILVQNPASMQLNLDSLEGNPDQILFAIGRDVHDPSWLWTVDYGNLKQVSVVSGSNYADAALVLKYNDVAVDSVEPDYFKAIDSFFALPKPNSGVKTILYSADAMRRLRRYKGFTDPEDVTRA